MLVRLSIDDETYRRLLVFSEEMQESVDELASRAVAEYVLDCWKRTGKDTNRASRPLA